MSPLLVAQVSVHVHTIFERFADLEIPTGAGKSSTIHLIERFFDPTSGQIYLDGQDIRNEAVQNHRARLALVVSQFLHADRYIRLAFKFDAFKMYLC